MAKILIVDDSDVFRMEFQEILEEAGHDVFDAINGSDGFDKLRENPGIELIITDLNMPVSDGIDLCRKVRSVPEYLTLPIFMLTTESSLEVKAIGKDLGVLVWIVKPFNSQRVLDAITKVLALTS
ncbi:MAG: response regulator [Proteobacteria bacterium]|nr:MAG: response regulator [Pseudomonadota bacterium]